jgi:hypothetical protein
MSLRIRVRAAPSLPPSTKARGYRIRPTSIILSIVFHVVAVSGLLLLPHTESQDPVHITRPIYDELIKPEESKIVWYSPPKKALPDVSAQQRIGTLPTPRAPKKSAVAIIATAPKPKSVKQFIWQKVPKLEIHEDLPAPNLIAKAAMAIPTPPPPPEPKPRVDKPDTRGAKSPKPNISPPTPNGDVNKAEQTNTQPLEIPKPRKLFIPPPPSQRPRTVIPVQTADIPLPDANISGAASARAALLEGIGAPSFSKGAPPPPNGPPGPVNAAGNGKVDIAVVGLHPNDKGQVPDGSRPGRFAQAPTKGEIATGEVKGGFGVPNLTIHDERKALPPPHVDPPRTVVLYADRLRSLPVSTLSVPLHPASRTIPASIEGRFRGRNVYTMVIPIENLTEYSSDWIIWFAQRDSNPGDVLNVRAPIPLRKFESVEPVPPGARTELRVQIAGIITKEGKLEVRSLLRNLTPALESAILRDVQSWEFKPATRDGVPVDVDIVLEIPFSLPPHVAQSSSP